MEDIKEGKRIHHGHNLRLARTWKNMTQETLADKLNIFQTDVSALEQKETIDNKMLDKIAQAMEIPVDFFTDFDLGSTMNSYSVNNHTTYTMSTGEQATGNELNQLKNQTIENQENIYNPLDTVKELYERLLKEKEQQIEELKARLK